ncbi:MAG: SRPBCC family protein [Alphaproteobacteria bacterium]
MLSVQVRAAIGAPAEEVWAVARDFNGLPRWVPGIIASRMDGAGVGATRRLTIKRRGDQWAIEKLESFDDPQFRMTYSIVDSTLPVKTYLSSFRLEPVEGERRCILDWSAEFEANNATAEEARAFVTGAYRAGLYRLRGLFMDKWDRRYLDVCEIAAEWSKDPRAKVGAIVADRHRRVVALGYNGFAVGVEDSIDRLYDQEQKLDLMVHAEQNAMLIAGRNAEQGTIYVAGKPVCSRCAGVIIQAGIKRVVGEWPADPASKWFKPGHIAIQMFEEAALEYVHIPRA